MIDKLGFKTFTFNKIGATLGAKSCFKYSVFVVLFFSITLQPVYQFLSILNNENIEFVILGWEEGTESEDTQENDYKEDTEITENQFFTFQKHATNLKNRVLHYCVLESILDFNLEILIPPPKLA